MMKRFLPLLALVSLALPGQAVELKTPGDRMLAEYFRIETQRLADHCLADIQSLDDWNAKKNLYARNSSRCSAWTPYRNARR